MVFDAGAEFLVAILLTSLRIAPTLAFAPPFTLLRLPMSLRLIISLSLAGLFLPFAGEAPAALVSSAGAVAAAAATELLIGLSVALPLQIVFAAMLLAGRAIDIQAGFALALLADPANTGQMPLIGTLFAYCGGAVFFAAGGPADLMGIWAGSFALLPPGSAVLDPDVDALMAITGSAFAIATGLAGIVLLTLFMIDLTIAATSRTLPQVPVLLLGFQVKTIAVLVTLPLAISLSASLYLRLVRLALPAPGALL
jgi:flagellar biosynthesis protein FliR